MAAYKKLSENISVAGQLFVGSLEKIKAQGFTTIICNRPDYEEDIEDQPLSADIERRASELGMQFSYIPIDGSGTTLEAVHKTKEALDGAGGPVLAYCLSGMRSVMLASQALVLGGEFTSEELIDKALTLGYNLDRLRPEFDRIAA